MSSNKLQLSAHNLSCSRGERQLFNDLSFDLTTGMCLHVVGANGSGKTTLLRTIAGLNQADSGKIHYASDASTNKLSPSCLYLGHLDGLKAELTAIENLRFFQHSIGTRNENQLDEILLRMQILPCADLNVSSLSFGQRRRLAFARLLLQPVTLWILDEPFTGVDVSGRELIESICLEHLKNQGAIMLSNHHGLAESRLAPHLSELQL